MGRRPLAFRLVSRLIAALAAAYVLIVSALWYWQASFIFQPSPVVDTTPSDLGVNFEKVVLPISGSQVAGWWVPSHDPQAATLLYSHGNANNVGANAQNVVRFQKTGLNVFIYDYRGYGESTGGPPREKLAYEDAERAWTYLVIDRRIRPARIAIYGHSLGSAVAIDLASKLLPYCPVLCEPRFIYRNGGQESDCGIYANRPAPNRYHSGVTLASPPCA